MNAKKDHTCVCEVLESTIPIKPFLDIDIPNKKSFAWYSDDFMNNTYVPTVIKIMCECLRKSGIYITDCEKPIILSSHMEDKYSLHIIFNVLLENLESVRNLIVEEVKPMTDEFFSSSMQNFSAIDPVVYNPGRLFRVFLTAKPGKKNCLVLDKVFATRFNQENWCLKRVLIRSLICINVSEKDLQYVPNDIKKGGDLLLNDYVVSFKNKTISSDIKSQVICALSDPETVKEFDKRALSIISQFKYEIEQEYPDRSISNIDFRIYMDKRNITRKTMNLQITPGIECPFHSGSKYDLISHKSNSTYVSVSIHTSPFTVTCRCADQECISMKFYDDNLVDIMRVLEMRHRYEST
jgi:hypothetical protein